MSGRTASSTQDKPTNPRPVDAAGRQLDQWGLPFSGPARVRHLRKLGKPDPNINPAAWTPEPSDEGRLSMGKGKSNGAPEARSSAGAGAAQAAPVAPGVVTEKNNG
ncbi:hypothetical protein SAMN02927924_01371 [Sphingobium faniae]|nr:hypothetical protein SAMN02927924_01371 [Sphingobium faniae]